ncbi:hypothetical protein CEE37_11795 [candidate division LCP-89 bacterium B3_LCP]|uniref:Uncharacterized protein n=1 Tax=candidate division LCP-89 bacterium B3_LCP TaxID=2012998 RepID=A0A532UVX6_UNCL8|nr:MAG: hypothetical protein CEE37_11795 [candidate division LCP-89 bacterium B3_LCP]
MKFKTILIILILNVPLYGQSIFEDALSTDSEEGATDQNAYELNGYLRGALYGGKESNRDRAQVKSQYAEVALKLRIKKGNYGDGYTEIRYRNLRGYNSNITEVELREAYIKAYIGHFDFHVGQQIVVWGRADGFNPTDNICPKDMLVYSPNEDDRRLGNFLFRSFYNMHPLRWEFIWVPLYVPSVMPTANIIPMIPGMQNVYFGSSVDIITDRDFIGAIKLSIELPSFDGSVSYFNGFNPMPGLRTVFVDPSGSLMNVDPTAYRLHILGMDFSTVAWGNTGIRGEFAYRIPEEDPDSYTYIPYSDLQYTVGLDKGIGTVYSLIVQYIGRYVPDFTELTFPVFPADSTQIPVHEITLKNRMIARQQDRISHSISFRSAWSLMYETLDLELMGLYDFTTEELFVRPKISYDIADDLTVTAGADIYAGPDDTLFGSIDSVLSALFLELKASF